MRNSAGGSSFAERILWSLTYVPLVDRRSRSRTESLLISMAQCRRETWRSSNSMSAPPPRRPIVASGIVRLRSRPFEAPSVTRIVIDLPSGRSRAALRLPEDSSRRVAATGRSSSETGSVIIVDDPVSRGTRSTIELCAHIQQRIWYMRRPVVSASSISTCALQCVQRTRMRKLYHWCKQAR